MTAFRALWGMPILLGVSTAAGLVAGLGIPVLVGAWHVFKPARSPH